MEGGIDKISLITKRDIERKLDLQKRKENRNNLNADNENLSYFEESFMEKRNHIDKLIRESKQIAEKSLPDHFNEISKEILQLQKYVANSNIFLRTYDIKKCQENLQQLANKTKELEEELMPKRKFGFKNKVKSNVVNAETVKKSKDVVDCQEKVPLTKPICGFSDRNDEDLKMEGIEIYKKAVTAERLNNCRVKFEGTPSTLNLNHLRNCLVITGPVSTSVFVEDCIDCTLMIACQQLRLHSSKNLNIYLHVTSRAIMEDCEKIFLAPYNFHYNNLDADFKESGLDKSTNNWQCVDDFNWLNIEKKSPNWALLE